MHKFRKKKEENTLKKEKKISRREFESERKRENKD